MDGKMVPAVGRGASALPHVLLSAGLLSQHLVTRFPQSWQGKSLGQWPSTGGRFAPSPQGHSAMSGDISDFYNRVGGATGI